MKNRIIALLLAVWTLFVLSACAPPKPEHELSPTPDAIDLDVERELSVSVVQSPFVTDYTDNWLTQKLETDLNCSISMEVLPAGNDGMAKLQLMINAGDDLPDVFSYPLSSALMYQYGSNGTFVPLNEYFANRNITPHFHAIKSEQDRRIMLDSSTSADGNIYCMTRFEPETWNLTPYRMYINRRWLSNLALETPRTTDELRDILQAFHDQDPNGNGKQDEIPLLANYVTDGNFGSNVILALINSFTYVSSDMSDLTLSADGRHVIAPQIGDGWHEAMRYLHSLYQVGAILPDGSFVYGNDVTGFRAALNYKGYDHGGRSARSVNIVGMFSAGSHSRTFPGAEQDQSENFLEYKMLPVLSSKYCQGYSPRDTYQADPYWFVTSSAQDPAFCAFMGDYFYEPEMSIAVRYGIKGEDWTNDPEICADWYVEHTRLMEKYADRGARQTKLDYEFIELSVPIWNESSNHFWHNEQPRYRSQKDHMLHQGAWTDPEKYEFYYSSTLPDLSMEYYSDAHPKYELPLLVYTAEEQEQIKEFQLIFPDVLLEWTMRFITGEADADRDWDAYVDALNTLGLDEYISCSQKAYERTGYYKAYFSHKS